MLVFEKQPDSRFCYSRQAWHRPCFRNVYRCELTEAIIRPAKVSDVCDALDESQKVWVNRVRGAAYEKSLLAKAREVVASNENADKIIKAIRDAALTGEVGDGKIFVHDMTDAIRIR